MTIENIIDYYKYKKMVTLKKQNVKADTINLVRKASSSVGVANEFLSEMVVGMSDLYDYLQESGFIENCKEIEKTNGGNDKAKAILSFKKYLNKNKGFSAEFYAGFGKSAEISTAQNVAVGDGIYNAFVVVKKTTTME